jgi:hypothetical protein
MFMGAKLTQRPCYVFTFVQMDKLAGLIQDLGRTTRDDQHTAFDCLLRSVNCVSSICTHAALLSTV